MVEDVSDCGNAHVMGDARCKGLQPLKAQRIVLKFGGTVCGRLPREVADICLSSLSKGPIAVVCSARSGKTKVEGTTNLLLKAAREATKPGSEEYIHIVDDILRQHIDGTAILSQSAAANAVLDLTQECRDLETFLRKVSGRGGFDAESEDRVLCVGERLSARLMTALLEDKGTLASYVDLSEIPPSGTCQGTQALSSEVFKNLSAFVGKRIEGCGDRIPVITGFFGGIPGGLLTNCGRGYSDLLAAIVAVGVDAKELQVWKEIAGVYTADPSKVPTATLLSSIHPTEANELTFYGSEVIHHFTIEQCIPKIPIRIKNVRQPDRPGTLIQDEKNHKDVCKDMRPKRPTAVTVKENITIVNVHSYRKVGSPEFLQEICSTLARWQLSVDLFELNETHVSLAVHAKSSLITMVGQKDHEDDVSQHRNLDSAIKELEIYGFVEVLHDMAILSLIGRGLKRSFGMAGKMFSALGDNNINIEMISQGASEMNISCVITERDALRALNVVHTELFTFLE